MRQAILGALVVVTAAASAQGITERTVEYTHEGTTLEGKLFMPESGGPVPLVLVIHDWNGPDEYEFKRGRMIAELGYAGFVVDVYGKGVRPANPGESAQQAGKYRADRALMRGRLIAALETAREFEGVDPDRIAAMGYCFGGGAALELARSGANILGAVSFHGNLDTPNSADANNIKASILVLHGAIDPFVSPASIEAFTKEMNEAGVDYQFISYSGAVHSFTEPNAGDDPSRGAAYDAKADARSWEALKAFLAEIF